MVAGRQQNEGGVMVIPAPATDRVLLSQLLDYLDQLPEACRRLRRPSERRRLHDLIISICNQLGWGLLPNCRALLDVRAVVVPVVHYDPRHDAYTIGTRVYRR